MRTVAVRERLNIPYSEAPGYEGSDQALLLAQTVVYRAIYSLDAPKWALKGDKKFRKYLKKFNQKVPTYDFPFLEEFVPKFWDAFRFILMRPDNFGRLQPEVIEELRSEFIKQFMEMPPKFRVKDGTELAAVNLMIEALQICLDLDQQLLANAIFEVVLLIWYHYVWPIA